MQDFGSRAISLDCVVKGSFDAAAMLFVPHIDEVINDDTTQISQSDLAADFRDRPMAGAAWWGAILA